ncbi:MAG: nucleotide pyrophosphohydrolase [Nanoarchaeota archaeon]
MSLKDIQDDVHKWVDQYKIGYWKPHEILARLTEETGELAREINHIYGPKKKKSEEQTKELSDEIADIIFTLSCLANSLNINLDESFQRVMDKAYRRDSTRFEKK